MPIEVALFQKNIGGKNFAFDTGDIAFSDGETKNILKNTGTGIVTIPLRKRQVTFTIRGANSSDIQSLFQARDNSVLALINATGDIAGEDIVIGADLIEGTLLTQAQAGPPITVAGIPLVEQTTVRYDSQVYAP